MKFRAHETFFIRKGWLNKGIKNITNNPEAFVSKTITPTDIFGLGSNMVKSLRYWLQALGLTEEPKSGKRTQKLTEFGETIFNNDKYFEEIGTLFLLHYKLSTNKNLATAWYYMFNEFNLKEFDREDFIRHINSYLQINNFSVSEKSLEQDFNCIISTYLNKSKYTNEKADPENNIECPFCELELIDFVDNKKKIYKFSSVKYNMIHPLILLAIIIDQHNGESEIKISSLINDICNPGKILKLDLVTMISLLYKLETMGYIKVIRTAGLDVIKIDCDIDFNQCVQEYYTLINK